MKKIVAILFAIINTSCISHHIAMINSGYFQNVRKNSILQNSITIKETIDLRDNYQFTHIQSYGRIEVKCSGKWEYIDKDTIFLKCEHETIGNAITQGYMPVREHKIKVINTNKLKLLIYDNTRMKYVILKRVR